MHRWAEPWRNTVVVPCVCVQAHSQNSQGGFFPSIDKVTRRDWQRKLMTSQLSIDSGSFVFFASMFWLAKWRLLIVTSGFSFTTQYANTLKPRLTQNDNTMGVLCITHVPGEDYYRKTQTSIVRENHVKCFKVFCTIF